MNMLRSDNTVSYEFGAPWAQKGLKKVLLAKLVIACRGINTMYKRGKNL